MALPTVTSRPEKTIEGVVSRWNAANLPLIYDITNTKWPTNSEDGTVAITSVTDDGNGFAELNHGSSTGLVAKEWVNVAGSAAYDGAHQIRSVNGNNLIIDFPFGATDTGTSQEYYNNYTTLIRVYAGIDPAHTFASQKPIVLIGTIEQRPDTDSITLADVRDYVKNKLNTIYNEDQASWPNDINGWTDFYIAFAERYDLVTAGVVSDFTSAFTDDGSPINYLHATHSALQFGNARGGNMDDYAINDSPYGDLAKWMTDFERLKIIDGQNWNVSIIMDITFEVTLEILQFDKNGDALTTLSKTIVSGNIADATFLQDFSVGGEDTLPQALFFRDDGLKMYIAGDTNDEIFEYDLGTAWDISSLVFLQSFDVSGEDLLPVGLSFKPDGFKMYFIGATNGKVYEYDLGIAWDVTSAVFLQDFTLSDVGIDTGLTFSPDGTKMFATGVISPEAYEYDLGVAWDVTSAVFVQSFDISAQDTSPQDIQFKSAGLKMYIVGSANDKVYEYILSTAWDISTAVFVQSFVISEDTSPKDLFFKPDGAKMYIVGSTNDKVYEYDLTSGLFRGLFRISFDDSELDDDVSYIEMTVVSETLELSEAATIDIDQDCLVVTVAPSSLVATAASLSSIGLTWTDDEVEPLGYDIQRSTSPLSGFVGIGTSSSLAFTDSTPNVETTYYYRVRATGGTSFSNTDDARIDITIVWTARAASVVSGWGGLAYNEADTYAAVGSVTDAMSSADAITWATRVLPQSGLAVVWSADDSQFVATHGGGASLRASTSPDGITWTNRTTPSSLSYVDVWYNGGLYVTVANTATAAQIMTSTDGITWTSRNSAQSNVLRGITFGASLWVIVSEDGANRVQTSPDGITWTVRTAASADAWQGVHFANGLFVAVGTAGAVMTSSDGITWTSRSAAEANNWNDVWYDADNGIWVAVASSGTNRTMFSSDGITWEAAASSEQNSWIDVIYSSVDSQFVAISSDGTNRVMTGVLALA